MDRRPLIRQFCERVNEEGFSAAAFCVDKNVVISLVRERLQRLPPMQTIRDWNIHEIPENHFTPHPAKLNSLSVAAYRGVKFVSHVSRKDLIGALEDIIGKELTNRKHLDARHMRVNNYSDVMRDIPLIADGGTWNSKYVLWYSVAISMRNQGKHLNCKVCDKQIPFATHEMYRYSEEDPHEYRRVCDEAFDDNFCTPLCKAFKTFIGESKWLKEQDLRAQRLEKLLQQERGNKSKKSQLATIRKLMPRLRKALRRQNLEALELLEEEFKQAATLQ